MTLPHENAYPVTPYFKFWLRIVLLKIIHEQKKTPMQVNKNIPQNWVAAEQDTYTFKREEGRWHIHLPVYLEQGWSKTDLQMTEGAHKFLNALAKGATTLRLRISKHLHQGWDTLQLIEHGTAPKGGAIYLFTPSAVGSGESLFRICDLTLFVFGDTPERIFVQRVPLRKKAVFGTENKAIPSHYSSHWGRP